MVLQVMPAGIPFGASGYTINNAIWLDGSADYLTNTFAGAGNNKTGTVSFWIKRNETGATHQLFHARSTSGSSQLNINSSNVLYWRLEDTAGAQVGQLTSTQVVRDLTAWMHVVVNFDTTNATAGNRMRMYINGSEVTDFSADVNPSLNADSTISDAAAHYIGATHTPTDYADCYLAEYIYIDGTQLDASSFGETDDQGNWVPVDPSGLTFGTNGFWLDFAVAPGTSNGAGTDVSGNGNHFTETSLTAAQQVTDVPTNTADDGEGNYAKISDLFTREANSYSSPAGSITVSNAGRTVLFSNGGTNPLCISTCILEPGNKYHVEWDTDAWGSDSITLASVWLLPITTLVNTTDLNAAGGKGYYISSWNPSRGIGANTAFDGSTLTSTAAGDAWGVGEVLSLDIDMSTIGSTNIIHKLDGGTVATDNGLAFLDVPYLVCPQVQSNGANRTWQGTFNFGDTAFATTPETDHVGISTAALSTPTVTDPSAYFASLLYTGNGTAVGSGGNVITGAGFQPDFVWIKNRDAADSHMLFDAVRGTTKYFSSDSLNNEATDTETIDSFDADGFTVGSNVAVNTNTENYVAWCFKADNTSGSSNTDGTITATVAAGTGFSIGTYSGNATSGATVGHGLSAAPDFIIVKQLTGASTQRPIVYHSSEGETKNGFLDLANAFQTSTAAWNDTAPTTSVFSLGNDNFCNGSSRTYGFYAFAKTPGLIGIGSYVGNGSADGAYVVVDDGGSGFRPAFLLIKNVSTAVTNWQLFDAARDPYNAVDGQLLANATSAESTGTERVDFTSNGFKLRISTGDINNSGDTIIYLAFAEYPFGGSGVAQARAR